jgi:hypothetical protein
MSASMTGEIKAWSWSALSGDLTHIGGIHNTGMKISSISVIILEETVKSPHLEVSRQDYTLACLSGYTNGMLESWIFSSNRDHVRKAPVTSLQGHTGSIIFLQVLDGKKYPESPEYGHIVLSGSSDGSCCLLGVTYEGLIVIIHTYFSPGPTQAVAVSFSAEHEMEIYQINEHGITSFIAAAPRSSSIIPSRWKDTPFSSHRPDEDSESPRSLPDETKSTLSVILGSAETPITMRKVSSSSQPLTLTLNLETGLNPYGQETSGCSPISHRSLSTDISVGQMNSIKIGHLSLKNLKHLTNREIWKTDNSEFNSLHDEINDEDAAPPTQLETRESPSDLDRLASWNITLGVRMELQSAKKDKLLLDYFRQSCIETKLPSEVVTARDAAEILDRWVAGVIQNNSIGDTITKKQVLDIFSVLNVSENDLLDFIKVAKLGAVLVTIHKNMIKEEPFLEKGIFRTKNRLKKKFSQMRNSNTLVTYNSMGEKVIQKRQYQEKTITGIPNGHASILKKIWAQLCPRVPYHVNGADIVSYNQCGILKAIPPHIKKFLKTNVELPRGWSSSLEHYFDLKRAVRISRTILDMRQNYQREFILNEERSFDQRITVIPSMSEIMVKYFERNFGGGEMRIAHQKIVHFLEALCQYSDFSLLNIIRYFIFSEEDPNSSIQKYIWLYVESRRWIFLHCDVVTGSSVSGFEAPHTSITKMGSLLEPSLTTNSSSAFYLNWLLIEKSDSLLCLREFLETRGLYGPNMIENVLSVILHALPAADVNEIQVSHANYIDLEQFLEALIFETKKQDQFISEIREQIFGSFALPRNTLISTHSLSDETETPLSSLQVSPVDKSHCRESMQDSLLITLRKVQEMLQIFIATDPKRTGFTSSDLFQTILMDCLDSSPINLTMGSERDYSEESLKLKLARECLTRYSSGEGSDSIGYIDFVALTMSWLYQQSEEVTSLHCRWILSAVASLRRGIDREQGRSLLLFLAAAQAFPSSNDKFWMARNYPIEPIWESGSQYSQYSSGNSLVSFNTLGRLENILPSRLRPKGISYEGNWNLASVVASDDPGLLTIMKLTPIPASSETSLSVDGAQWKNLSKKNVDSALFSQLRIPSTDRDLQTVHGEVSKGRLANRQKCPPPISSYELTSNPNIFSHVPQCGSYLHRGIRYEGCHPSKEGATLSPTVSKPKFVSLHIPSNKSKLESNDDMEKSIITVSAESTQMPQQTIASDDQLAKHQLLQQVPPSLSLGTGYISNNSQLLCKSANIYSDSLKQESLEDSLRDFESMRKLEEEMMKEIEDVNLQATLKLHEKYLKDKESKRLMRFKEQESMRFKEEADVQRSKRRQQALMLEEKSRALEETDRLLKEEETKKKQGDIRAARATQEALKREKELLEAELHREMLELQAMRKEERLSTSVEKANADKIARFDHFHFILTTIVEKNDKDWRNLLEKRLSKKLTD